MFSTSVATSAHNPNGDAEVPSPPGDTVSALRFWNPSPTAHCFLAATSWDGQARVWEVKPSTWQGGPQAEPRAMTSSDAPLLDVAWHSDGSKLFLAGCNRQAVLWDLQTNSTQQVAAHDTPVRTCHWVAEVNVLATTAWDRMLRYWDLRQARPALEYKLAERAYCADLRHPLYVVAQAERHISVFNLASPDKEYRHVESTLRHQIRCIATFVQMNGFAVGSTEGRVGIQHVEATDEKTLNFSFKCHRQPQPGRTINQGPVDVFAVNSIAFHPLGTFATAGSDGAYAFWDKGTKQRLTAFKRCPLPITAATFDGSGELYAYATGYDWSRGHEGYNPATQKTHMFLHATLSKEIAPKPL